MATLLLGARAPGSISTPAQSGRVDTLRAVPSSDARDRANVERLERALADDSMEGRGTATPGGERAARFLAGEMKKIGLKPAGDSGFFQRVPLMVPGPQPAGARGRRRSLVALPSLADLDTVPDDRRRHAENVVGILPGGDPQLKNEVVLVLSHYDHLGIGHP